LGAAGVPLALPTFVVGLIASALNSRYQRLGDLVCGTMVIVEVRGGVFGITKLEDSRAARLAACIPAHFQIDQQLSLALSTYVERRRHFLPPRRSEIARRLAEPLVEQFQLPPDTSQDLLLCALYHRAYIADHGQADDLVSDALSDVSINRENLFPIPQAPIVTDGRDRQ
jgi:hypothetical protein